jgi:hypothetical protein
MTQFKDVQIQFEQRFDGGYRFFDKSGEFVTALREEFGFMLLSVNLTGRDMESPDTSLRLHISADRLLVVSMEPEKQNDLVRVVDFASKMAIQLFLPFVVEYNQLALSSLEQTFIRIRHLACTRSRAARRTQYQPLGATASNPRTP